MERVRRHLSLWLAGALVAGLAAVPPWFVMSGRLFRPATATEQARAASAVQGWLRRSGAAAVLLRSICVSAEDPGYGLVLMYVAGPTGKPTSDLGYLFVHAAAGGYAAMGDVRGGLPPTSWPGVPDGVFAALIAADCTRATLRVTVRG